MAALTRQELDELPGDTKIWFKTTSFDGRGWSILNVDKKFALSLIGVLSDSIYHLTKESVEESIRLNQIVRTLRGG